MSQRANFGDQSGPSAPTSDEPGPRRKAKPDQDPSRIVFLTAGAAGMYCGSCMHDNALAKALRQQQIDCLLQPVYTPVRTDSASIAEDKVFLGGVHIYLLQRMPWLRVVPAPLRRLLDWAPLLRWVTRRSSSTDAKMLGGLTLSMLRGTHGRQAEEVNRLVDWIAGDMRPHCVVFSNLLIGGSLPALRQRLPTTQLIVLLQGDDIFLDFLEPSDREAAIKLCHQLSDSADVFVTNSRFYADKMSAMLRIDREKFVVTPLSIDVSPFDEITDSLERVTDDFRLGYCARIAPEKGLHHLVDAFIRLATSGGHDNLALHVAGWLGNGNETYFNEQKKKIDSAGLADRFHYHGSPDLQGKVRFLRSLDLLSVPTDYQEPKGLFVLEAFAAGVPVVQPRHGAFVELIESTGGGVLFEPGNIRELCHCIETLKQDDQRRRELAEMGHAALRERHSIQAAATDLCNIAKLPVEP